MEWIYVGIVAGSLVASLHPSKEACLGRKTMLEEQKIPGKCVEAPSLFGTSGFILNGGNLTIDPKDVPYNPYAR
jgi:hypothetical protein